MGFWVHFGTFLQCSVSQIHVPCFCTASRSVLGPFLVFYRFMHDLVQMSSPVYTHGRLGIQPIKRYSKLEHLILQLFLLKFCSQVFICPKWWGYLTQLFKINNAAGCFWQIPQGKSCWHWTRSESGQITQALRVGFPGNWQTCEAMTVLWICNVKGSLYLFCSLTCLLAVCFTMIVEWLAFKDIMELEKGGWA